MGDRDIKIEGIATLVMNKVKWVVHGGACRAQLINFSNFVVRYS